MSVQKKELNDAFNKKIGSIIRSAREEHGISVRQFAKNIDVSPSAVSKWETGQRSVDRATLARIANLLNIDSSLFGTDYVYDIQDDYNKRAFSDIENVQIKYIFTDNDLIQSSDIDVTTISRDWMIDDAEVFTIVVDSDVINKAIPKSTIAAIAPNIFPDNGNIVLVKYADKYYLRRMYTTPNSVVLEADSTNEKYDPIFITSDDAKKLEIIGVAIGFISNTDHRP